jgi:hypothetical protein
LKRNVTVVLLLVILAAIDGYLLSAISFVGRAGINLMYTEYQFLKTWWKGALLVFIVWMLLFAILSLLQKKLSKRSATLIPIASVVVATAGLYLSYADFRNSLSHRLLGERFHLGVYLFWFGWIGISILMVIPKKHIINVEAPAEL